MTPMLSSPRTRKPARYPAIAPSTIQAMMLIQNLHPFEVLVGPLGPIDHCRRTGRRRTTTPARRPVAIACKSTIPRSRRFPLRRFPFVSEIAHGDLALQWSGPFPATSRPRATTGQVFRSGRGHEAAGSDLERDSDVPWIGARCGSRAPAGRHGAGPRRWSCCRASGGTGGPRSAPRRAARARSPCRATPGRWGRSSSRTSRAASACMPSIVCRSDSDVAADHAWGEHATG